MIDSAYILMIASLLLGLDALFYKGFTRSYIALAFLAVAVVLVVLNMRGY